MLWISHQEWWKTGLGLMLATSVVTMPLVACAAPGAEESTREARIKADVKATPTAELNQQERQAVSLAGRRLLRHVDKARSAIQAKNKDDALNQVNQGLTLVKVIEQAIPEYTVNATIKAGSVEYVDTDQVKDLIVPIFDELGRVSVLGPIKAAKKDVTKKDAAKEPKDTDISVIEAVEQDETQVWLNVALAKSSLLTAEKALMDDKLEAADLDLTVLQAQGVTLVFDEAELPLVAARENLMLARVRLDEQHLQEARAALQEAATMLTAYEKTAQEPAAKKAQGLREEMSVLSQTIEQDQTGATDKIDQWWDQLAHWNKK